MTSCDDVHVLLALRPDDRSVTQERRVQAHLAVCADCAGRAEAFAEQDRVIGEAPRVALTSSQRDQLLSTIERKRRRQKMRSRLFTMAGATAAVVTVIALIVGAKLLAPSHLHLIPSAPFPGGRSEPPAGRTARFGTVDFAVVGHELTGCVTLESGEERCPPEGARYVWVKMRVENSEHYPTADNGPQLSVVHQGQPLPEMVFLPEGKSPRSACTPEGYYRDEPCEFWIGGIVPDGVDSADLTVRASWRDEVAVWPLGGEGEARVFSAGRFAWPTRRREMSGWAFHDPRNATHAGIDIAAEAGDPVFSIADGIVTRAGWDDERGNMVVVEHADGWSSTYAQLEEMAVEPGQRVTQGQIVGRAGSTGESSGPHLHFELHYHGQAVNPLDHLPSQPDLRDLLLREEELPGTGLDGDDWEPETIYMYGDDWVRNLAQADGCLEALKVEGFRQVEEDEAGVYVWHSVYRFEEARQARAQYDKLLAGDMLDSSEILYEGTGRGRMQATAMAFTGSEGEAIYWLFGLEDTVLHLLMVDSFGYEHAREIFEATVSRFVPVDLARDLQDVEVELAKLFVDDPDGECGWEVLGEGDVESYAWAICQAPSGTAVSAPALIYWEAGRRTVLKIQMPRDGSFYEEDVRLLFPAEVQERIFAQDVDKETMWEQIERDLTTVTGTVVDNAASAEVVMLKDGDGEEWHIPWRASRGVRWPDGSAAEFREIERGMRVEVVGFRREATTPNVLSAVRVTILSEVALGVDVVIDCAAVYPGRPGCLQEEPLVGGRLAFVDERAPFDGRPVALDLEQGDAHILGEEPDSLRGWSPSGDHFLTGRGVYGTDGQLVVHLGASEWPAPAFWAPAGVFSDERDWLIRQTDYGGLEAVSEGELKPLPPIGPLAADGRDTVLLSTEGQLAWTPGMDRLVEAGEWAQEIHVQTLGETGDSLVLHLSDDIREMYYRPISWVPGTRLILAGRGLLSASLWADGVPLVTIDGESGEVRELGVTILLTSEAYDWHPTQPGLLALAAGGGRFINENKRLALLDVTSGDLRYLTEEDEAVLAPAWSPDGELLAYARVPAWSGAMGEGETMESTLEGRAIFVVDPTTGESHALTEPGEAIDGWPRWSADGEQLLYTRQREGQTEVRVVAVDGSGDEVLVRGLEDPMCFYGGCAWDSMVGYAAGE